MIRVMENIDLAQCGMIYSKAWLWPVGCMLERYWRNDCEKRGF